MNIFFSVNFVCLKKFNVKVIYSNKQIHLDCSVVTVGTFDGVHRGHQKVIKYCIEQARKKNCQSVVYTFFPHPRKVLQKGNFKNINTQAEKLYLLEKQDIDVVFIQNFSIEFSQLSAKDFIEQYLLKQLSLTSLVIGYDHHLGKNREGSYDVLIELSKQYHFDLYQVEPFIKNNINVSSSKIRSAIESGNLSLANEMLGYPYIFIAQVKEGLKLGRKLGFPTANLDISKQEKLLPPPGVYAVLVDIDNNFYKGALNIGYKPTLELHNPELSMEVHLIDFDENIYGKTIVVFFMERLRDDIKFDSLEELSKQIKIDVEQTNMLFNEKYQQFIIQKNIFLF